MWPRWLQSGLAAFVLGWLMPLPVKLAFSFAAWLISYLSGKPAGPRGGGAVHHAVAAGGIGALVQEVVSLSFTGVGFWLAATAFLIVLAAAGPANCRKFGRLVGLF